MTREDVRTTGGGKVEPKTHELAPGRTDQHPRHFLSSLTLMVCRPYASYGPRHGARHTPWPAVAEPQEGPGGGGTGAGPTAVSGQPSEPAEKR